MLKVLIISPYFPPSNAADMQRLRTSLPYYEKYGWIPEVVCVDEAYSDMVKDPLLTKSIPNNIKTHKVKAFPKKMTAKLGLGSIALRSLYFYRRYVDKLLETNRFDLIYFSTTQFPICILGRHWKKRFNIPYVIDMQDPWHSDYYQNKPKTERPKKYWFSYRLNKFLEPIAMRNVDGLISVSLEYINVLKKRYQNLTNIPFSIIPFGAHKIDFQIATQFSSRGAVLLKENKINFVYTGAVGAIMKDSISFLCKVLAQIKKTDQNLYNRLHFYFIGTSYAPAGEGINSVTPIANEHGIADCITEETNRIGYFEALALLKEASALLILGSDDQAYNPSKIFTYALAEKFIIGIFKNENQASVTIEKYSTGIVIKMDEMDAKQKLQSYLSKFAINHGKLVQKKETTLINFAEELTKKQCEFFNLVCSQKTQIISNYKTSGKSFS